MPKILDCTLRDGGYINNWNFPSQHAKNIINLLKKANIDFIEAGFYHHNLDKILPDDCSNLLAMVQYSKVPACDIPDSGNSKIKTLRIIFKKHEINNALPYCLEIKNKGYKIFINATFISEYNDRELVDLIKKINEIKPYAFTLTDSMGVFTSLDIKRIYKIIENELSDDIALCFHSHNNLSLSYSNTKTLIELNKTHELIIDSTVFGMGRGAGNLKTELLINLIDNKKYDIAPILQISDKYIKPIFLKHPWGYSIPYYLSAIHKCHPDYAKFLIDKKVQINSMDKIFSSIPSEKKAIYDFEFINDFMIL